MHRYHTLFFSPRCRPYYHKLIGISKNTYIQSVSKICVYINLKDEKYMSPGSHIRCQLNYNVWISVTSYALVISVDIKLGRFKFCVGYQSFFYRSLKSSLVFTVWYAFCYIFNNSEDGFVFVRDIFFEVIPGYMSKRLYWRYHSRRSRMDE